MDSSNRELTEGILYTDMYQLTMAQLYFRVNMQDRLVQFDHFFREYPDYGSHKAGYCVNAGLEWLLDWMRATSFSREEYEYLRHLTTRTGRRLFADDFLDWLEKNGDFSQISLWAIPEGRVIHPNVPITVVQGPLAMAQESCPLP